MRLTFATLIFFVLFACNEDDVKTFDLALLNGKWNLVDQSFDNISIPPYSQIHKFVNIDTQNTVWTDTIYFGNTYFQFFECGDPCIVKSFNLSSANVRTLNGYWEIDSDNYTVLLNSLATESMDEDTLINEHRYSFHSLLEGRSFKIAALNESILKLKSGDQVLEFERE